MGNLVTAEFRKILTTKSWWALLIPAAALAVLVAMGWAAPANAFVESIADSAMDRVFARIGLDPGSWPVGLLSMAHAINVAVLFSVIFGVFALAGEEAKKTITTTFLTAPNRTMALSAKMLTYIAWGVLYGVVIVVCATLGTLPVVGPDNMPTPATWFGMLGAGVLASTLAMLFGIGIGALVGNVTGSVVAVVIYMLIVENLAVVAAFGWGDISWLGGVLPNGTLNGIVGSIGAEAFGVAGNVSPDIEEGLQWTLQLFAGAPGAFSWWASALIFLGWTLLAFGGGWLRTHQRDIT